MIVVMIEFFVVVASIVAIFLLYNSGVVKSRQQQRIRGIQKRKSSITEVCPFCSSKCIVQNIKNSFWECCEKEDCNYRSEIANTPEDAKILHNLAVRKLLREFARWCTLEVLYIWNPGGVVEEYFKTGDEALRIAAHRVAWRKRQATEAEFAGIVEAVQTTVWLATQTSARKAAQEAAAEARMIAARSATPAIGSNQSINLYITCKDNMREKQWAKFRSMAKERFEQKEI